MEKVSVIIPIYNGEEYLEQCLDSVLSQSLREIEVICVDDGSTDETSNILRAYEQKDSRVRVIYQQNKYAGVARNNGMENAQGKYLAFLDADDFFEADFLEKMYEAAEKNASDIVMCNAKYFNIDTGEITQRNIREEQEFLPQNTECFSPDEVKEVLFQLTNGWAWDKLFRTDFVKREQIYFADTRIANDGFFVYTALAKAERITKIKEHLVIQRINNKQSLSNTRARYWACGFAMLEDICNELKKAGLYGKLEKTFRNFCLKYVVWSIDNMTSWTAKADIWTYLQSVYEPAWQLLEKSLEYYYVRNHYERYVYILEHSFAEYAKEIVDKKDSVIEDLKSKNSILSERIKEKVWSFPYEKVKQGERVVLYGAGQMGQDYKTQIDLTGYCKLVLWLDKKFEQEQDSIKGWIYSLHNVTYDKVVIALKREGDIVEVRALLKQYGVPNEKIISI